MLLRGRSHGFSLIEVLVTAFVLSTVAVALTGLSLVSTRSAIESERQNVAQALANEKIENLVSIANSQGGYKKVDFTDNGGVIPRTETVDRNGLPYTVEGFVFYVDDPKNGSLPAGTPVTKTNADFTKVLYKISWPSNLSGSANRASSSTVVAASIFVNEAAKSVDACVPDTEMCENLKPDCVADTPAGCPDSDGNLTLDCPSTGVCPGSSTKPFVKCPTSGKCEDVSEPTPSPDPSGEPNPGASPNPAPIEDPEWCQQLPFVSNNTREICDLSFAPGGACNDGLDNDLDGGTDSGIQAGGPDLQCERAFNRAADGFNDNGHLVQPVGPCNYNQCPGTQLYAEIAPYSSQCSNNVSCSAIRYFYAACQTQCNDGVDNDGDGTVDVKDPECGRDLHHASEASDVPACKDTIDNDGDGQKDQTDGGCDSEEDDDECGGDQDECQKRKGCPKYSTCTDPNKIFPEGKCTKGNCCADTVPKCSGTGLCFECINVPPGDPEVGNGTSACNEVVAQDPERDSGWCQKNIPGSCECKSGKCVQCTKFGQKDEALCNQIKTPYCSTAGACVECLSDRQCAGKGEKSHCRLAKFERNMRNTCQDECHDGVDNDGDGGIDAEGLDRNGDGGLDVPHDMQCLGRNSTREKSQCSDTIDNDGDGKTDFNADPGCLAPDDNDERNDNPGGGAGGEIPVESPDPRFVCSDHLDNDGDGLIDFPQDPGCVHSLDTDESNASFQCSDRIDNDGDGKIDFPQDPGCSNSLDDSENDQVIIPPLPLQQARNPNGPQCMNGVDDDRDGRIDFDGFNAPADPDCSSFDDAFEGPIPVATISPAPNCWFFGICF